MNLTPKQAAARVGVSQSMIYTLLRAGKIPALRIGCRGKGKWLIDCSDFDKWVKSCQVTDLCDADDGEYQYLK